MLSSNKTKTKTKNQNKIKTKKGINYFVPHSRLSRLQRKYCKCLMVIRPDLKKTVTKSKTKKKITNGSPYGLCYYSIRKYLGLDKTKGQKKNFEFMLNKKKANCTMNYNYDNFNLQQVQALAKEMKIPITYIGSKDGKKKQFAKSTLVKKITSRYLDKKKRKQKKN